METKYDIYERVVIKSDYRYASPYGEKEEHIESIEITKNGVFYGLEESGRTVPEQYLTTIPRDYVVIADWEDMHNDYPYVSPKQYGLEVFKGTHSECKDYIDKDRKDWSSPYSNYGIEYRGDDPDLY